jgi:hypothetical protein
MRSNDPRSWAVLLLLAAMAGCSSGSGGSTASGGMGGKAATTSAGNGYALAGPPIPGAVSVLPNQGGGVFAPAVGYGAAAYNSVAVAVADVDGDGKPDIVAADDGGNVSVLLNQGNGIFAAPVQYSVGRHATSVVAAESLTSLLAREGHEDVVHAGRRAWRRSERGSGRVRKPRARSGARYELSILIARLKLGVKKA